VVKGPHTAHGQVVRVSAGVMSFHAMSGHREER